MVMKKVIVIIILMQCCLITIAQKSMLEGLKLGETFTMKVASNGDTYTDPDEYYIIQVVRIDSTYALSYTYRGAQAKKKINVEELSSIITYEKTAPDRHAGLSYDEVTIKCGRRSKRFVTVPNADAVFLKKLNLL
jgi:hypothetical protein